jgi:hypothetical protein
MNKLTIKITHVGEDYAGVELNGEYNEVTLNEHKNIQKLLDIIKSTIKDSNY